MEVHCKRLAFVRGDWHHGLAATGTDGVPVLRGQLFERTRPGSNLATCSTQIFSLSVDRHRGGQDNFFGLRTGLQNCLQQIGCALIVDRRVIGDLVHGLTYTHGCGQVIDDVHPSYGVAQSGQVPHVAANKFCLARNVCRFPYGMHLLAQVVVDANRVTAAQQCVSGMGSDKAGAPGNQDFLTLHQAGFRLPCFFFP